MKQPSFIFVLLCIATQTAVADKPVANRLPRPAAQAVDASWAFEITARAGTERFSFTCTLPRTLANRQAVRSLRIQPTPTRRWIEAGTEYALFEVRNPAAVTRIEIDVQLELYRADLQTLSRRPPTTLPANRDLSRWLKPENYIESDDPAIAALALSLPRHAGAAMVRSIMQATLDRLTPGDYSATSRGAAGAMANGTGDCSEYSDLFVALCRARGVPAYVVEGQVITPLRPGDTPKHAWTEAHIDGIGWVPFDPFHVAGGWATFDQLSPTRIITSVRRNDPTLEGYHHWAFRYHGEPIAVRDTFTVRNVSVIPPPPASRTADTR